MNPTTTTAGPLPGAASGADIADWRPEDDTFWEGTGKKLSLIHISIGMS